MIRGKVYQSAVSNLRLYGLNCARSPDVLSSTYFHAARWYGAPSSAARLDQGLKQGCVRTSHLDSRGKRRAMVVSPRDHSVEEAIRAYRERAGRVGSSARAGRGGGDGSRAGVGGGSADEVTFPEFCEMFALMPRGACSFAYWGDVKDCQVRTLNLSPYTLHPTLCTLHPRP